MSCVGSTPSARAPAARYAAICSARRGRDPGLGDEPLDTRLKLVPGSCRRLGLCRRRSVRRTSTSARRSLTARDSSSLRAGASPSQNGMFGGAPLRVGDADDAGADLQHPPRGVAELEHVAGHALDREVLVQRADERVVGIEHHAVVGDLRDRAARGEREQPRAAPAAQPRVHLVAMDAARRAGRAGSRTRPPPSRPPRRSSARGKIAIRPRARDTARTARPRCNRGTPSRRRSAAPARRAARRAGRCDRARRGGPRAAAPRTRPGRRATSGRRRPFGMPATVWPERPTRWSSVAMRCGDPIWQTRST